MSCSCLPFFVTWPNANLPSILSILQPVNALKHDFCKVSLFVLLKEKCVKGMQHLHFKLLKKYLFSCVCVCVCVCVSVCVSVYVCVCVCV